MSEAISLVAFRRHAVYRVATILADFLGVDRDWIALAEFLSLCAGRMAMPLMYLTPEEPDYRCADCGKSICSLCAQKCARCEKPICKSHETKVCRSCMANPLTKRSPSRMRWLLLILFLLISSGLSVLFSPFDQFATLTVVLLILFVALVCVVAYALLEPAGRWLGLW